MTHQLMTTWWLKRPTIQSRVVWRDIEATNLSYLNCSEFIKEGSLLNDAIHWLAFCCDVSMNVILAFDLTKSSFSDILLLVEFLNYDFESCYLEVLGDLLSVSVVEWNHSVETWVMEEYKVQLSWTKTSVVSTENIPAGWFFFPICSTKGGDIFGTDSSTRLAKYNDKGHLQEHRSYCNGSSRSQVALYTKSLLPLPI
ncbi:unnamed protein product [Sphenostylis stenocarpa]|uniref:F-box associated domain-containing protein n=1 Tax=Sphenostylis stenocarpa TaxID=92480 RepID=A0AA86VMX8_9FABA|nr:unnamed protein product [Sphenostylis stenocarpa]